jgi:hypothetical protein
MEIPFLKDNQFAVGKAQLSTGHVLRNDGAKFLNGQSINNMYEIFESYEEAEIFVLNKINDYPEIKCWIVNAKGEHIITYDYGGERKFKKI